MRNYDYDLFVIGAGSGGVRAARLVGAMGKKVAIAEDYRVGGTCVIRGCVPKKLMVYASHYRHHFEDSKGYGWSVNAAEFDWEYLKKVRDDEVERLSKLYIKTLENNHVQLIKGRAQLSDDHTIRIEGKEYTAKNILLATGGQPFMPPIEGIEHGITSNGIFHLPEFPKKLAVVGAGFIALEFAGIFNGLGAEVNLIYRGDQLLRGFDQDVRQIITDDQEKQGIHLNLKTNIVKIEKRDNGQKRLKLDNGDFLDVDAVLFALGRKPNLEGLHLEKANIEQEDGFVKVDQDFCTSNPHIGAVGDIIKGPALTPVALREAMAWVNKIYEGKHTDINYEFMPSAVFSSPNISVVGASEAAAKEQYGEDNIDIYTSHFRPMIHTLSGRDDKVFLKLVVHRSTDKILGVHMIGHDAGETIQGLAIALTAGATKEDFNNTIGIHPTIAEDFTFMNTKR